MLELCCARHQLHARYHTAGQFHIDNLDGRGTDIFAQRKGPKPGSALFIAKYRPLQYTDAMDLAGLSAKCSSSAAGVTS